MNKLSYNETGISKSNQTSRRKSKRKVCKAQGTCDKVSEEYIQPYVDKKIIETKKDLIEKINNHWRFKNQDVIRKELINLISPNDSQGE